MFLKKRVAQKLPARATHAKLSRKKKGIYLNRSIKVALLLSSLLSPNHQIERISPFFEKKKRERGTLLCDDDEKKTKKKEIKSKKTHLLRALLPLLSKNLFRCC